MIDIGSQQYLMYAHLKQNSIRVTPGQEVKVGEEIAETGNSGNSPFPHLHFHLQNSPTWFKGAGLPIQFGLLNVNGKLSDKEPIRSDVVRSP